MNMILNFTTYSSKPIKFSYDFINKEKNNFVNVNNRINNIQIGKRNHDVFDCDLKWGSFVHRYLELTMPSDYKLSSKDQVDYLVKGLDKKEVKNLDEIIQNITNRKETTLFNETIYKSAINEFSFMLDQKLLLLTGLSNLIMKFMFWIIRLDF